jgi:hypothetical protein
VRVRGKETVEWNISDPALILAIFPRVPFCVVTHSNGKSHFEPIFYATPRGVELFSGQRYSPFGPGLKQSSPRFPCLNPLRLKAGDSRLQNEGPRTNGGVKGLSSMPASRLASADPATHRAALRASWREALPTLGPQCGVRRLYWCGGQYVWTSASASFLPQLYFAV